MDYIGSKEKLNDWMFSIMKNSAKNLGIANPTFLDACAGSGSVSKFAAKDGMKVVSNDLMSFSSDIVIGSGNITEEEFAIAKKHIVNMNALKGKSGFFFKNYSESAGRLYFSDANAKKIDACRMYIDNVDNNKIKSYLKYCILEAMSRVSNTAGVQAAFLKELKERAKNRLEIKEENRFYSDKIFTYNYNILDLLKSDDFKKLHLEDILYIDPPYNERQYAPNYHLYETLAKYDNPKIHGKTGLRDWISNKSEFCSKKTCLKFLSDVVNSTRASIVFVSYSSDGLLSRDEIEDCFLMEGYKISTHLLKQKRYKSDSDAQKTYDTSFLKEFLFEIKK